MTDQMTASAAISARQLVVIASAIAIEGYDLSIYALFAVAIAHNFFPVGHGSSALLLTVATLGVGYVMRPLGGIVLGLYADRVGRKVAIALTVLMMSISTGIIAFIPSHAMIGLAAPLLVVAARLVQGFSSGGATAGSIAYLVESAPPERRGFYASWQQASQICAFLLSATIGMVIARMFSPQELNGWAWRIPFLLALLFGPIGLYIKRSMPDPDRFKQARQDAAPVTLGSAVRGNIRSIATGFGVTCLWNITAFILLFYMPTYVQANFGLPLRDAFTASVVSGALLFLLCPLMGALSDRVGRRPVMLTSALLLGLAIYPMLAWFGRHPTLVRLIEVQCVLAVLIAGYTAPVSAFLAELFPIHSRSTGLSIAYNLSTMIMGAFGPLIVTWLIIVTGDILAPAYYVAAGAAISAAALLSVRGGRG